MTTPRADGSCATAMPDTLRWGADRAMASLIGCHNRRGAEPSGAWEKTGLAEEAAAAEAKGEAITFFDSTTSRPLFVAPRNRTMAAFLSESRAHGWPSFRDEELVTANLLAIRGTGGEVVSVDGTHLGHNLPDRSGNRYCINLVSVAGNPA